MDAAHRRLSRGRHGPSLAAILSAVETGFRGSREAGIMKARDAFAELRFSDFGRRRLARFFSRSHVPRRASSPALPSERKMQNVSAVSWVAGLTIGAALRQTANRHAGREAMVFAQAEVRMTWAEFDQRVDRVARGLLAIGMRRGDHFGVWSTNWPEWVLLQFATARAGIVLVTINPSYRAAELQYSLAQSDLRGIALIERYRNSCYFDLLREACPGVGLRPARRASQRQVPSFEMGGPHARLGTAGDAGLGRTRSGRRCD